MEHGRSISLDDDSRFIFYCCCLLNMDIFIHGSIEA